MSVELDYIANDAELAATLADLAGKLLVKFRASSSLPYKELGKAGDEAANEFLMQALALQRPDDGVLSEESKDTKERLSKSRVWIIDPVDGTREYSERRSDWAVHVALAIDGVPLIGAVALPDLNLILRTDQPQTVPDAPTKLRMVVSRTRPAPQAVSVANSLDAQLIPMGSAGAKAMAVVRGEADIYLHAGGQYEWDSCAPAAVAAAHGLHISRANGSPLIYNQADVYMPDLLICRPEHVNDIMAALMQAPAAA